MAVIIACAVNLDGRREIIGMGIGESEAKAFWLAFLLSLKERGLEGVKLVITDSHSGLKAAIQQLFSANWQRYRVHFMRNVLSRVSRANQSVVRAALQQVFVQTDEKSAHATWRVVAGQLRARIGTDHNFESMIGTECESVIGLMRICSQQEKSNPAVTEMMDEAEADVLAYFSFPKAHTPGEDPLNQHAGTPEQRSEAAGDCCGRLPQRREHHAASVAVVAEQNAEWLLHNRYMPQHYIAENDPAADNYVIEALPLSA